MKKIKHTLDGLSDSEVMDKLGHTGVFPEGRFFPDTYRFVRGMSDVELLQQAYMRLDEVLAKEWAERTTDLPYRDPYQALIMASLVEKETGIPQERGQIAGVFVRRLRLGMMLQTDPTVIYGMGERYNGKITRADLREPTPYNTYTMTGLPPTPIAWSAVKRFTRRSTLPMAPACTSSPAAMAAMCSPTTSTTITRRCVSSSSSDVQATAPAPHRSKRHSRTDDAQPQVPATDEPAAQPSPEAPPVQDAPAGGAQAAERPTPDEQH